MRSIHELLGKPLVTVLEGTRLGTLQGVWIDIADGRTRFLCFDGAQTRADGVVHWESIRAIDGNVIMVDAEASAQPAVPAAEMEGLTSLLGDRAVVTEGGIRLGNIVAYDLDESTGRIERYHVSTGGFFGRLVRSERTFLRDAVRVIGPDAIIVSDDACVPKVNEDDPSDPVIPTYCNLP